MSRSVSSAMWSRTHFCVVFTIFLVLADVTFSKSRLACRSKHIDGFEYHARYGNICYHFVVNQVKPFRDAQNYCKENGGQLAIVKSKGVNEFIGERLVKDYDLHFSPVWIGLEYHGREGLYRWVDGTDLGAYSNFREGTVYFGENCVAMTPATQEWVDYRCGTEFSSEFNARYMFVCEYHNNEADEVFLTSSGSPITTETTVGNPTVNGMGNG